MQLAHEERGLVTLETTLMVVILVPLLFGVIEFGWLFQRWLAADTVAVHAARYAGELTGSRQRMQVSPFSRSNSKFPPSARTRGAIWSTGTTRRSHPWPRLPHASPGT